MLVHEILLTRICALRLYFHFAFLVVSNCLLGMGASGALLMVYQEVFQRRQRHFLAVFTGLYLLCLVGTFVFLRTFPIPEPLSLSNPAHLVRFTFFNLVGALPFFFGGTVIGMLLTFNVEHSSRLYAVDLLGAGLGCLLCPGLLPWVGAGGVFVVTALLALAGLWVTAREARPRAATAAALVGAALGLWLLPTLDEQFPVPSKGLVDVVRAFERARGIEPHSVWTANSRIDLLTPVAGRSSPIGVFGQGAKTPTLAPEVETRGISQDATAGTTVIDFSSHPEALDVLRGSLYSASVRLRPGGDVFVIGLGGGNDVWAAKANGARSVRAIELNWPIVQIHEHKLRDFSQALIDDPTVDFVVGEGRSELMRDSNHYDVVQMTGIDTWTALASGAYVLAENYLYTREAIESMLRRLEPGGILQITRFAEVMEALRLLSNINAAFERLDMKDLETSVMALSTPDKLLTVMVKNGPFTEDEENRTLEFAEKNGINVIYLPRHTERGPLRRFLHSQAKAELIARFPRNIAPTTDDEPYFFNFTRWDRPLESIEHIADLPSVSQGNPFFILSQLLVSILLSGLLIVLPVVKRRGLPRKGALPYLAYFASLGIGFIFIEISAMQKLTLLLGQPVYSITVTLFSLLVFTGLGSLMLVRRFGVDDARIWAVPGALAAFVILFLVTSPAVTRALIGLSLPVRIAATILMLAPIGLLLGVPFAYGLRVVGDRNPALLPWAWAINGCLSVVGSILTVIVSMNFGFSVVMLAACVVYLLGFLALRREVQSAPA